ncbi:MAG TPA: VanZ family protein [Steroidobacteraceae bacterium]|nr:VanZ family protein [Steroidobacteraceae bacterium]
MASRTHFAAPLLLAIVTGLIVYVSLYPFRFAEHGPTLAEALQRLGWQRAGRGDIFNNLLLYAPFGFCAALVLEPRWGRIAGIVGASLLGLALSVGLELLQASVSLRVSSLRDVTLNGAGTLAGASLGTVFHAITSRISPQNPTGARSAFVAMWIVVLWVLERLWPLVPDPGLRQLKRAVRPLLSPSVEWMALAGLFVGWLVVAQAVFHIGRKQRAVDLFLVVTALVLAGRVFVAGSALDVAELAAIAMLLPVLVLLSKLEDGMRSTLIAMVLGVWLAWSAVRPLLAGSAVVVARVPDFGQMLLGNVPAPPRLANKAFSYVSLGWLLAGAGVLPHVAAGITVLFVLLLTLLQLGAPAPVYGWVDLLLAGLAGWIVVRWMPRS